MPKHTPLKFWVKGEPKSTFKSRSQAKRYSLTFDEGDTIIKKVFGGFFGVFKK
jgi:hypothetical protein